MAATTTRTRKPAPKASQTAAAAPAAAPVVVAPESKAPRVRKALLPIDGCSLNHGGTVEPCTEHKTYASDPHCRVRSCPSWIGACDVHVLQKGGTVIVQPQPVQQPQARARRRRTAR